MPRLRLLTPLPELSDRFPLKGDTIRIGREVDNDLVLPHPTVSRYHAVITLSPDGVRIEDRGSSNGTYHNGEKVDRAWLKPGDRLFLGKLEFRVEDDQPDIPKIPLIQNQSTQEKDAPFTVHKTRPDRRKWVVLGAGILLIALLAGAYFWMEQQNKRPAPRRAVPTRR